MYTGTITCSLPAGREHYNILAFQDSLVQFPDRHIQRFKKGGKHFLPMVSKLQSIFCKILEIIQMHSLIIIRFHLVVKLASLDLILQHTWYLKK